MKVTLAEIERRIAEEESDQWVSPRNVGGIDVPSEYTRARHLHFYPAETRASDNATAGQILSDYMNDVLIDRKLRALPPPCSPEAFLDDILFLIRDLGSTYAVFRLARWRTSLLRQTDSLARRLMSEIQSATDPYVQNLLREFVKEVFEIGGLNAGWEASISVYDADVQEFLRSVVKTPES